MKVFKEYIEMHEASYSGNIGIMELIKFKQKATPEQKKKFDSLVKGKKNKEAWNMVQDVTGVKLHKSVHEEHGAGEEGTDKLRKKYQKNSPGQKVKSFTDYVNKK